MEAKTPTKSTVDPKTQSKESIIKEFIINVPIGHAMSIIDDIKTVLGKSQILPPQELSNALAQHLIRVRFFAPTPDNYHTVLAPEGRFNLDHYLEPHTQKVYQFDYMAQRFGGKPVDLPPNMVYSSEYEPYRRALSDFLDAYRAEHFNQKVSACAVFLGNLSSGQIDDTITLYITGYRLNVKNHWTGSFYVRFQFKCGTKGSTQCSAELFIQAHYYEQGNIQLNMDNSRSFPIVVGNVAETTKSVSDVIRSFVETSMNELTKFYNNVDSDTLKPMRRFLPVSQTLMNWDPSLIGVPTVASKAKEIIEKRKGANTTRNQ